MIFPRAFLALQPLPMPLFPCDRLVRQRELGARALGIRSPSATCRTWARSSIFSVSPVAKGVLRPMVRRSRFGKLGRVVLRNLWPTQRLLWTFEGVGYVIVWVALLIVGLYQQVNLILL